VFASVHFETHMKPASKAEDNVCVHLLTDCYDYCDICIPVVL